MNINDLPISIQKKVVIILKLILEKYTYRKIHGANPALISLSTFVMDKKEIYQPEVATIIELLAQKNLITDVSWRSDPRVHPTENEGDGYWPEGVDFILNEDNFNAFIEKDAASYFSPTKQPEENSSITKLPQEVQQSTARPSFVKEHNKDFGFLYIGKSEIKFSRLRCTLLDFFYQDKTRNWKAFADLPVHIKKTMGIEQMRKAINAINTRVFEETEEDHPEVITIKPYENGFKGANRYKWIL
ncbi:MAG: hypothetical protein ABIP54_01175 [Candidatus Andersenbacteria bacterium]